MMRILGVAVPLALVAFALPAAAANPLGDATRTCQGTVDFDCTDYRVVCEDEDAWSGCRTESTGRYCVVFTTVPPDVTWPDDTSPVCRHETYGEPPVGA